MAAGYRSALFRWFTGYAVSGEVPPAVLCPCPTYGHDATLSDTFINETTLVDSFTNETTLADAFSNETTLSDGFVNEITLASTWKRGTCNG